MSCLGLESEGLVLSLDSEGFGLGLGFGLAHLLYYYWPAYT